MKVIDDPVYCLGGAAASPKLLVEGKDGRTLAEGIDYTVKYKNNKKPGSDAGYTVTFTGNYKGKKKETGKFEISAAPFTADTVSVSAADLVYLKAGKLKPVIYVTLDGRTLSERKDYTVKLFKGTEDVTSKRVSLSEKDLPAVITVKVTGKGVFKADTVEGSFNLVALPEGAFDLTTAKVVAKGTTKPVSKQDYTGSEIRPEVDVMAKIKGEKEYKKVPSENAIVTYRDNISRGTASIVVTGDNVKAFGSMKTTFAIGVRSFKEILTLIFGKRK